MQAQHPDVELALLEAPLAHPTGPLYDDRADVLLARLPLSDRSLLTRHILLDPLVAAVPDTHPLAGTGEIELTALQDQRWLTWHDDLLERCDRHGFTPQLTAEADSFEGLLKLVAADAGIALVPRSAMTTLRAGITNLELRDEKTTLVLAWREERRSALVDAFLAATEREAARLTTETATLAGI